MLIQELEQKSGLPRATIRYYEKEGFLSPNRLENGYRVYSQEDLEQLMKIHLLRELGMSLDTIRQIQKGEGDFHRSLSEQMQALDKLSKTAQRAKDVCARLYENQTTYASLDAVFYLQELNKPSLPKPSGGEKPDVPAQVKEPLYRQYHPVRRFLARITDYQMCYILVQFLLVVVCRIRPVDSLVNNLISLAIPFILIPIEAFLLNKWGTTPGKWLYGLSVWDKNGYTLSYDEAKTRTWLVLKRGYGFGIPFFSLYRLYKSYMQYGDVEMDWDRDVEYEYHPWKSKRKLSVAAAVIVLSCLSVTTVLSVFNPIHRGELTLSQFADNYNFYVDALGQDGGIENTLKADGSFHDYPSNIIYVGLDENQKPEDRHFTYSIENEKITEVIYQRECTDAFIVRAQSEQCMLAALTMVMSQRGNNVIDLLSFLKKFEKIDFTESGSIQYENVEMRWEIEQTNYVAASGDLLVIKEQEKSSWLKINYRITVLES